MKKPKKCRECAKREMEQARKRDLFRAMHELEGGVLKMEPCKACGRAPRISSGRGVGEIGCEKCGHGILYVEAVSAFTEAVDAWNKGLYLPERQPAREAVCIERDGGER